MGNEPTHSDYKHVEMIQKEAQRLIANKYINGVIEHGGHLWERPVEDDALDEAIDQVCYLITLRDQVREVVELASKGLDSEDEAKTACFHIIQTLGRIPRPGARE